MRQALKTATVMLLAAMLAACGSKSTQPGSPHTENLGEQPRLDTPILLGEGDQQVLLQNSQFWSGIEMFGADAGFNYAEIAPTDDGNFNITSRTVIRMRLLQQDKELVYDITETIAPDLTLQSFRHRHNSDGYIQVTEGHVSNNELHLSVHNASGTHKESHTMEQPLYAYSASSMYPALHGLSQGEEYSYMVYDNESRKPMLLQQQVQALEVSPVDGSTPAWRIQSNLKGIYSTAWIDTGFNPIQESTLNGNIIVTAMSEEQAIEVLARASINKSENLIDFSIIHTDPLPMAEQMNSLDISFTDVPDSFTIPITDGRQSCARENSDSMNCHIRVNSSHDGIPPMATDTASTTVINTDHPDIQQLAHDITSTEKTADARINDIILWIVQNIASEAVDAFTAVDVLQSRRGECQGQSMLYTSLARAVDVPTRVVNGMVYSQEHGGFLYHTWAESWDGKGWRSVDPTLRQNLADATHIRLSYGAEADDIVPLIHIIGRIKAEIIAYTHHER